MDRASISRALFFSHRHARVMSALGAVDLLISLLFAVMPDDRTSDYPNSDLIFSAQAVLTWINIIITCGLLALVWVTFSVTQRELTFERQSRMQYVAVFKFAQVLIDMMLTAFPTVSRQVFALTMVVLQILQIFYALYIVRQAREVFTRRIRPPLVIKALLDMKGDAHGKDAQAEPLTLGMLERLEGIVKVRTQMKFSVRSGRQYLVGGVATLLVVSVLQYAWEFTKILTYSNRFFTRSQIETIADDSNLPMYWPSFSYDPATGGVDTEWAYRPGGAGCQSSGSCQYPRDTSNSRLYPVPTGDQRVVLVVMGGLSAQSEFTSFLRFRSRAGWQADGIELLMRAQLPSNAVPNWITTLTGMTPDLVGALGNRDIGRTAYDNIFRMMRRFQDRWWTYEEEDDKQYEALMAASPWFTGLAKNDLPLLVGDGSASWVSNEDDILDRSEIFQASTYEKDLRRFRAAKMALSDPTHDYHFLLLHMTNMDGQAANFGTSDMFNQANYNHSVGESNADAPWEEFIPADPVGTSWRKNSYKRAIARSGDQVDELIDRFGDDRTTFLIVGDHGHVAPGGSGGVTDEVSLCLMTDD